MFKLTHFRFCENMLRNTFESCVPFDCICVFFLQIKIWKNICVELYCRVLMGLGMGREKILLLNILPTKIFCFLTEIKKKENVEQVQISVFHNFFKV